MSGDIQGRLGELERQVAELRRLVDELSRPRLSDAGTFVPLIRRLRSSIESLERRLTGLSNSTSLCADQVAEIRRSRTWRTLIRLGAWLLWVGGAFTKRSRELPVQTYSVTKNKDVYWCDEPANDSSISASVVSVRGWFFSQRSVTSVMVAFNGSPGVKAALGLLRPDVAKAHPEREHAAHCGYEAQLPVADIEPGEHFIEIAFRSGERCLQTLRIRIRIISRTTTSGLSASNLNWNDSAEDADLIRLAVDASGQQPLISVLMPVYNPRRDALECAIRSVIDQSYPVWELCIANDGSHAPTGPVLDRLASLDSRIRVVHRKTRGGIAVASNSCLAMAKGDIIVPLDQDDELAPHALLYVADCSIRHPSYTLIYSDEDKLAPEGYRYDPFLKPDWSPDLLRSMNYIGHLMAMPRTLAAALGGFSTEHEGSQDYDLVLRASEQAGEIVHIPSVLYHWRAAEGSVAKDPMAKPFAHEAALRAIADHVGRSGETAVVEATALPGRFHVRYSIPLGSSVSIIIASGGRLPILTKNLETLVAKTHYSDYEIVVADNSRDEHVRNFISRWNRQGRSARYLDWRNKPFNYSAINNAAARTCSTPLLLFLNDDTEVISPEWLDSMVELATRPVVGAVGAKLLYPDGRIQHAGVTLGVFDCCANSFQGVPPESTYFNFGDVIRNVAAVTGACLLTRSDVFWRVGGFDEQRYPIAFNDVDLCLKIGATRLRILYTPRAVLYHHEAYSKEWHQLTPATEEVNSLREHWKTVVEHDPFYNPRLSRTHVDFSLAGAART